MRKRELAYLLLIFAIPLVLLSGCGTGGDGGGSTAITTQTDADQVASAIKYSVTRAAPHETTGVTTWNNASLDGYFGGTATVNGVFTKTVVYNYSSTQSTYDYNYVTVKFNNYCDDSEFYPTLTGTCTIDGTAYVTSTTGGNSYSGYWDILGTLTLSQKYSGNVTIALRIRETGSTHSGILTVNGTDWTVSY